VAWLVEVSLLFLGLSVELAQGGAPLAFALAGIVALLTTYSYVKLSVAFPSRGGTVMFLNKALAQEFLLEDELLLWISYIVMLSLYASAFGSYGTTFFSEVTQFWVRHLLISGVIIGITGLNLLSADLIGRAENWIVIFKLIILGLFVIVGIQGIDCPKSPAFNLGFSHCYCCWRYDYLSSL
jgi:amino acid transporter